MHIDWTVVLASGLASFVEFVEAFTIVLAVIIVRGWKEAIIGSIAAVALLAILVIALGPSLTTLNTEAFKIIIGTLIMLFGLRWLRKAILRASGVIAKHDEEKAFEKEKALLESTGTRTASLEFGSVAVAFNGVLIEGVEVIFIVLAIGSARGQIVPASFGAAIAGLMVIVIGLIAKGPLTKIPENLLKFIVGILVSTFGTFWVGEGLQIHWFGGDFSTLLIAACYLVAAILTVFLIRATLAKRLISQGASN